MFQLLVLIGNCHSSTITKFETHLPLTIPTAGVFIEGIPTIEHFNKLKQENMEQFNKLEQKDIELINKNIELTNQVKQLSKQMQQLLTKVDNMNLFKPSIEHFDKLEREHIEITITNNVKQLSKVNKENIELINKNIELVNQVKQLLKIEQEDVELKNQVKQLSEQMQQLLTKENDIKQVNESCNNKYLELKSIYKQFYRVQMFETTKFRDIFNRNHNDTEQEILEKIPMYTSNIEDTKQFLELCLPNILCNNTKNTVQLMIDRYNNALVKIDECKSLINQLFTASTKDRGQKKQKLHIICSEIDSETRKNYDVWNDNSISWSSVFKTIKDETFKEMKQ